MCVGRHMRCSRTFLVTWEQSPVLVTCSTWSPTKIVTFAEARKAFARRPRKEAGGKKRLAEMGRMQQTSQRDHEHQSWVVDGFLFVCENAASNFKDFLHCYRHVSGHQEPFLSWEHHELGKTDPPTLQQIS